MGFEAGFRFARLFLPFLDFLGLLDLLHPFVHPFDAESSDVGSTVLDPFDPFLYPFDAESSDVGSIVLDPFDLECPDAGSEVSQHACAS